MSTGDAAANGDVVPAVPPETERVARAALAEVSPGGSVGAVVGWLPSADGVRDLLFASLLPGYTDWRWTVSMAQLPDLPPSVLELELLPGDGALLAPAWVPWEARLAEYRRLHPDEPIDDVESELDEDEDEDELDESDDLDPADELDDAGIDVDLLLVDGDAGAAEDASAEDDHPVRDATTSEE